jgi:hypothetical protein
MSAYTPATALRAWAVDLIRSDGTLSTVPGGLLFPAYAPQRTADDVRVYGSNVQFPVPSPGLVYALPRILIETIGRQGFTEQDQPGVLLAPVRLWTHVVAPKEDEELAERIDAYLQGLLPSTWVSGPSIIGGKLSIDGDGRRGRIEAFNGAWEIVTGYSTPNVGSL